MPILAQALSDGAKVKCPIGRRVIDPCPRKVATGMCNECQACIDDWHERADILEYGQGTGGTPERTTCATRADAEAEATRQLRDAVERAERKQREMFR